MVNQGLSLKAVAGTLLVLGALLQIVSMIQIIRDVIDDARAIAEFRRVQSRLLQPDAGSGEIERTHSHERTRFDKLLDDLVVAKWNRRWGSVHILVAGTLLATSGGLVAVLG
jgi:hypothetical protein